MPEAVGFPFHFLRPLWLIALLPLALMFVLIRHRQRPEVQWGDVIAPQLLKHLIVRPDMRWSIQPLYLVAAGLAFGIIALSGPTWRRELPPFVEDQAPLMIALSVSSSMTQRDVAPSRLDRAKQKIDDLLAARAGARTGIIAYAGSAHLVMPLTDDRAVIAPFLAALTPGLMPSDGHNTTAAVQLAANALASEPVAGTILVVADDLSGINAPTVRAAAGRNSVLGLAVIAQADRAPSDAVRVSVDGSDIRALERRIETRFQSAQTDQFGARWLDEGYWLLVPVALVCLAWFRRGVTVQWLILFVLLIQSASAFAQDRPAQDSSARDLSTDGSSWFRDLWLTPDQQGRLAFDRGDYARAKALFADPMWRGIAAYRAYDYLAAAEAFQKVDTPEGRFALGNAQAQNHAYEKAIAAYDEVLKAQPDNVAAKTNRAIVLAALKQQEERRRKQEEEGGEPPSVKPDDTKVDRDQKRGKRIQVRPKDVTTAGAAEAWMREVQTTPADFLKLKFAIQAATSPASPEPRR